MSFKFLTGSGRNPSTQVSEGDCEFETSMVFLSDFQGYIVTLSQTKGNKTTTKQELLLFYGHGPFVLENTISHVAILPLTVDWFITCEFGFTQSYLLICFCMALLTLFSSLVQTLSTECLYSAVCRVEKHIFITLAFLVFFFKVLLILYIFLPNKILDTFIKFLKEV